MEKNCIACNATFQVLEQDLAFYERMAPVIQGVKYPLPAPTLCPMCRLQRRMAHRNQIFVYTRPSSWSGKPIFSMYTDTVSFPVIERDLWWGDSWDPLSYGKEFDFSRGFFEQFQELENTVPHPSLAVGLAENSNYCNHAGGIKNCYFIFNTNDDEDCYYCETIPNCKDCLDCSRCSHCEQCYDCVECANCYALQTSESCDSCSDSYFLLNCRSCQNCFGCVNLRRAQFCIFNVQHSKDDYAQFLKSLDLSSFSAREEYRLKSIEHFKQYPRPHAVANMSENFTGNFIFNSQNVHESYSVRQGQDVRYTFLVYSGVKDCCDLTMFGKNAELLYECLVCGVNAFNLRFCYDCWESVDTLDYCILCHGASDLFGCVGIRKKQFCILNKQYTEKQYRELVPRIIKHMSDTGEWGEYFPMQLSTVPYNRSIAQRYFPLTKDEILTRGLSWYERDTISAAGAISASALCDGLPSSDDSLTVMSALSNKLFRITTHEIKMYRRLNVPLPRTTYDERMEERQQRLGGIRLYDQKCSKTGNPLRSTIIPDAGWTVWDREVYERELNE